MASSIFGTVSSVAEGLLTSFIASERILKINQELVKIWTKVKCHIFYGPSSIVYSESCMNTYNPFLRLQYYAVPVLTAHSKVELLTATKRCPLS